MAIPSSASHSTSVRSPSTGASMNPAGTKARTTTMVSTNRAGHRGLIRRPFSLILDPMPA